jgi:hypothetical protein
MIGRAAGAFIGRRAVFGGIVQAQRHALADWRNHPAFAKSRDGAEAETPL